MSQREGAGNITRSAAADGLALKSADGRIALTATVAASGMASLDATVVNVPRYLTSPAISPRP